MNKEIIKLIEQRLEKGKKEYNEELNVYDGRDWLQEALEEQLDGMVYIAAKLLQLKKDNDKYLAPNSTMWNQLLEKAGEIEDYANDIQAMSEDLRNNINDIS
jgi:uncharacterized phage infection (PIP) family protein YhgE